MPTRKNAPISSWQNGDQVQGFALVLRRETRQDKNGRPFLDLELSDASGTMVGKVWGDSAALDGDFDAYDFVAFRGSVKLFRDALQLSVEQCRRATEADRADGFDEGLLIPSTREDIDDLLARLHRIYPGEIGRPVLRRLAEETLTAYGAELKLHPAAKGMHHAYRGGLLEHVVSMAELALKVCSHYRDLDRDLVLLGVLFHDLGKIRELGAMPINDYTLEGRLVGHVVIGRDLVLERAGAIPDFPTDLRLHLEHLVLSHQGRREFAAAVEPMTAEALTLHFIDDLDAKLNQIRLAREAGQGLQFLKGLGRYFFLDRLEVAPEPAADEDDPTSLESPQPSLF
ncbi:MAG TPA: HD domain-containing protein [Thermoanaerobaculia bacterium]|nr:HD domain-containing protein [Thermoanaerobaculia bacterium]